MNMMFVGLNERGLEFLHLKGKPATRQIRIIYEDGSSKVLSEHRFIEIQYEQKQMRARNGFSLIAYYADGELIYEERIQQEAAKPGGSMVFTALWSIKDRNWVQDSLWTDSELTSYK